MNDNKVLVLLSVYILDKEEEISLDGYSFIFGRSSKSDICLNDPSVSRSHFQFFTKPNELWISDLCPSNSTYINGIKLENDSRAILNINDVISIDSSDTKIIIKQVNFYESEITLPKIPIEKLDEVEKSEVDVDLYNIKNFSV